MWAGPRSPSDLRVCNPSRTACPLSGRGAGKCPGLVDLGAAAGAVRTRAYRLTLWGPRCPPGIERGPLPERKASCLAPVPRLGLPGPCLTVALSLSRTSNLWASMMSSGTPPPPHSPALAISNLWSQCLAALQSWLTFSKKKKVDLPRWALGRDPHGFLNPLSLTPGSTLPTAALASLGAWPGRAPGLSGQTLTSRGQRLGGWGAGCEPLS